MTKSHFLPIVGDRLKVWRPGVWPWFLWWKIAWRCDDQVFDLGWRIAWGCDDQVFDLGGERCGGCDGVCTASEEERVGSIAPGISRWNRIDNKQLDHFTSSRISQMNDHIEQKWGGELAPSHRDFPMKQKWQQAVGQFHELQDFPDERSYWTKAHYHEPIHSNIVYKFY